MANNTNPDKVYKEFGVKTGENTSEFFEIGADARNVFIQNGQGNGYGDVDGVVDLQTKLNNFNRSIRNIGSGTARNKYATAFGYNTSAEGSGSHAEGYYTLAQGPHSHAEGSRTSAYGMSSHAEGYQTTALGEHSHTEGSYTKAQGISAHAEGYQTTAIGDYSHVEGISNIAGKNSHVEGGYHLAELLQEQYVLSSMDESVTIMFGSLQGNSFRWQGYKIKSPSLVIDNQTYDTYAYGELNLNLYNSHPYLTLEPGYYQGQISNADGGYNNIIYHKLHEKNSDGAFEIYSYEMSGSALFDLNVIELNLFKKELQNISTYDSFDEFSHIQGKYSTPISNCAHIVGGGTSDTNRKNIHTLDWIGNAEFAGDVIAYGCGKQNRVSLSALARNSEPLILGEGIDYLELNSSKSTGDKVLNAILNGRKILIKVLKFDSNEETINYSPVIHYRLPVRTNKKLKLFYLKDNFYSNNSTDSFGEITLTVSSAYEELPVEGLPYINEPPLP